MVGSELEVCHSFAGEGTRSRSFEEEIGCSRDLEVPCPAIICVLVVRGLGLVEAEVVVCCCIGERSRIVAVGCTLELTTQATGSLPSRMLC